MINYVPSRDARMLSSQEHITHLKLHSASASVIENDTSGAGFLHGENEALHILALRGPGQAWQDEDGRVSLICLQPVIQPV